MHLNCFKEGVLSEREIREHFGHIDGIERSIAVAMAAKVNTKSREDVKEIVQCGF